jgi:hypothetical protein
VAPPVAQKKQARDGGSASVSTKNQIVAGGLWKKYRQAHNRSSPSAANRAPAGSRPPPRDHDAAQKRQHDQDVVVELISSLSVCKGRRRHEPNGLSAAEHPRA